MGKDLQAPHLFFEGIPLVLRGKVLNLLYQVAGIDLVVGEFPDNSLYLITP